MKMMINLTSPQYVMPFHGDHRRIRLHSQLAESLGIESDAIFRGQNGVPLEIDARAARFGKAEQAGVIFVDGVDVGDPSDVALRDRRMLSADGIFIVVATISGQDGQSVAPPELIFRGVPFIESAEEDLLDEIRDAVDDSLAKSAKEEIREISLLQDHLHDDVARFVYDKLRRRPMVLPVVVEV
jgi:ribonuclease J